MRVWFNGAVRTYSKSPHAHHHNQRRTEIFYKDWVQASQLCSAMAGRCRPMIGQSVAVFLQHGYRVIAHDRRGHGRSTQTADGHDMTISR